jgi:hypothetical protein
MLRRMQCKYLPARSAIRDGQSRCNQDAIKMQSRCNQMQSGARFERYSEVLRGPQWASVGLSGTQWYSEVLRRPPTPLRVGRRRGREGEGRLRLPQNS